MGKPDANPNVKRFDEVAASWDEMPRRVELARAVAAAMIRELPLHRQMKAMEFGCGTGLVTLEVAPRVGHLTAIDSSKQMLAVLERKIREQQIDNITPQLLDLTQEQLPAGPYHLIFSSMTLHHIGPVDDLLAQFARVLAPGGYLAIADLEQEDGSFHDNPEGVMHHGFDQKVLASKLQSAGFGRVRHLIVHRILKENESGAREYPVFLVIAQKASS
ncbi:MAG: class I SAM-dependent methyltransferase [Calditrichaeota bacterium]|nr:MAG: class I SAM-dependent methyltransferase [Calditrichota bacterium]